MRKPDYFRAGEVERLFNEALLSASAKDYQRAEELADRIGSYGYLYHSSILHMKIGNVDRARELIIPIAEECCINGEHIREAALYKIVEMTEEHLLALEEHRLQYETRHGIRPIN